MCIFAQIYKNVIVINNTSTINQTTNPVPSRERVMGSTMSVDGYFDELISQIHEDYVH